MASLPTFLPLIIGLGGIKRKKPTLVKDDLHIIVPRLVISSLCLSDFVGDFKI